MKRRLAFGVMLAVTVLLGAGVLLAERMPQKTPESSGYSELSLQPLISCDTLPLQVSVTIGAVTTEYCCDQQAQVLRAVDYDEKLDFDQNKLGKLFASMSSLSSRATVEALPADLSIYGLEQPAATVTAVYPDGNRHTVRIGSKSPLGDGFYGMLDNDPAVYLLLSYDVDSFLCSLYDFRAPMLLPLLGAEEDSYAVELMELVMQRKEGGTLSFSRAEQTDPNALPEPLWITQPVVVESDQYLFIEQVVKGLFALQRATPVIEEDTPQDLARYGLDAPDTLYLRDGTQELRLLVGNSADGKTFLMREGIPSVLSVKSALLSFLCLDYEQVMSRMYWMHNINDVQSLLLELGGNTYTLDTSEASAGRLLLNNRVVPEAAGRSLFAAAIGTQLEQRLAPDAQLGPMSCRLTAVYKDGTEHTLTFYSLNERQLALQRDNEEPAFYCASKDLQKIADALEALA